MRTGAINRTLRLRNVCCNYSRIPTCTHCRGRFIVPAYYGIHAADNRVQSMFILVHPLGYGVAFIQFGTDGSDKSDPYAYGMYAAIVYVQPMFIPRVHNICPNITLRIVLVHQRLPTYTHCDACLYLHNSVRTGAMNRPLRLRNVRCGLFMHNQCLFHEHVIFTHVHQRLPTCTHCRGRFIVPAYYGIHGVGISLFH